MGNEQDAILALRLEANKFYGLAVEYRLNASAYREHGGYQTEVNKHNDESERLFTKAEEFTEAENRILRGE